MCICVCFCEFTYFQMSVCMYISLRYIFYCLCMSIMFVWPEKVIEYSSTIKSKKYDNFSVYRPIGEYEFAQIFLSSIVNKTFISSLTRKKAHALSFPFYILWLARL
jgi:hypothetical protein